MLFVRNRMAYANVAATEVNVAPRAIPEKRKRSRSMDAARSFWMMLAISATAVLMIGAATLPAVAVAEGCANEARRVEQGAESLALPDCRAYELVSPSDMPSPEQLPISHGEPIWNSAGIGPEGAPRGHSFLLTEDEHFYGAVDGDAVLFRGAGNAPNSQSGSAASNLSVREAGGWKGSNIVPPTSLENFLCGSGEFLGFSQNLEQIAITINFSEGETGSSHNVEICGHYEPPLAPGEPEESANLLLRDTATSSFQLVNVTPHGVISQQPQFDAISADGSHVVFGSKAQLTPNAPPPPKPDPSDTPQPAYATDIYVWSAGRVHLLTVLPNATAVSGGALAGALPQGGSTAPWESAQINHAVSADGERILFYAGGEFEPSEGEVGSGSDPDPYFNTPYRGGGLYLREHPGADQSALNGSGECTEPEKACSVQIDVPQSGASGLAGDGQFRWASAETTKIFFTDEERLTADSTAQAGKPDLYEYDAEKPRGERLTDLTVNTGEPADVLGVSGAADDGSYVYLVAKGDLTGGQENSHNARALAGQANLYVRHAGATTFVATLNANEPDRCDWTTYCLTARVSANGEFIGFNSIDSLTGYDNHPVQPNACETPTGFVPGSPCMEIFRYAASAGVHGELTCASCNPDGSPPAAKYAYTIIDAPRRVQFGIGHEAMWFAHNVADSGEVFFDTMEKLLPGDENQTFDVYDYAGGEGPNAQLYLISTGKSEEPSTFYDATPSGSDVFFATIQPLLRGDIRADYDAYDARVDGGFASQDEAVQRPACTAVEACRSPLSEPPAELSAASAALSGAGNLTAVQGNQPGVKTSVKELTRTQRQARALKACTNKYRHNTAKRHGCERQARGRYGAKTKGAGHAHNSNRRAGK